MLYVKYIIYLGSDQKEVLSSSGTISVTFKYLAIATMSQICMIDEQIVKIVIGLFDLIL